jgi:hypothetical protein
MNEHLSSFPLRWRLCEEKYDPLPAAALACIRHVADTELSRAFWRSLAAPAGAHLMEGMGASLPDGPICRLIAAELWTENLIPCDLLKILDPHLSTRCHSWTPLLLFWNDEISAFTSWRVFEAYWHNFFYPDDDSGVVPYLDRPINLYFIEDKLYLVDRELLFAGGETEGESGERSDRTGVSGDGNRDAISFWRRDGGRKQ